ncbi:MAG: GNAT family protein [Bacteroidota bacterium]
MTRNEENCYLRAFEPDDYKTTHKWRNDPDVVANVTENVNFVSSEREKLWVEEKIFNDKMENYWAICDKNTNEMVGYTSISKINIRNRNAWMGEMVIDEGHWNKGYELAANALVLEFVFDELGLNRLYTSYLESNEVSKKIFADMGFSVEGVLREDVYKGGKFHNVEVVSLLKSEYLNLKNSKYD